VARSDPRPLIAPSGCNAIPELGLFWETALAKWRIRGLPFNLNMELPLCAKADLGAVAIKRVYYISSRTPQLPKWSLGNLCSLMSHPRQVAEYSVDDRLLLTVKPL